MKISGLMKMTLLDYPGLVAATIFFGGCNFLCPFCHNKELVIPSSFPTDSFSVEEVLSFLDSKKNLLDGVCISGGEPTLQKDLIPFIRKIKELGYHIKLDTNGSNPDVIIKLCEEGLVEYIAMDIKHCIEKYPLIINTSNIDLNSIKSSVAYIKNGAVSYEFRTTVVREYHCADDFYSIANWLSGADTYVLQPYVDSNTVISPGFHAPDLNDLTLYANILKSKIKSVTIRGV